MISHRVTCDTNLLGEVIAMIHEAQNAGASDNAYVGYDDDNGDFIISWDTE